MNGDRCIICDRFRGHLNNPHPPGDDRCPRGCNCTSLCWGDCRSYGMAVDWRARAIAAGVERDAALAEVDRLSTLLAMASGEGLPAEAAGES